MCSAVTAPALFRTGDVVSIRDRRWRVASCAAYGATAVLQALGCDAANRAERATFVLPFEPCTKVPAPHPRVVRPRRWRHVARAALADATPSWWSLRSAAAGDFTIFPYQLEPALAMVRGDACRFLIADAVGLGKTVQAALMIAETAARQIDAKAIVVCPAGLRDQWRDELCRRFGVDARIVDAASMIRAASELPAHVNPWSTHPVVVTSIDYIKRPEVIRALEGLVWDIAVFDEAHNLATHSDRSAAAALIAERARQVALLTATPHGGDDASFARMCSLGQLGHDDQLLVFRRSRRDIGIDSRARDRLVRVSLTQAERTMHDATRRYAATIWQRAGASPGARLAASVLMRRACSSAASLARSVDRRLTLMTPDSDDVDRQRPLPFDAAALSDGDPDWQLSSPGLADASEERRQLEAILQLALAASEHESKLAALRRLLRRIDEPAIVFTEYRDTLARVNAVLGIAETSQLHGGLTRKERAEVLNQFTRGRSRLLLATDAGSEGLNLHHRCRVVVNLELPWLPRRLEQRRGRIDRIGQSRQVHALSLVARDSCEEEVVARLTRRRLRAGHTMDLLSRTPSEEGVAAMVFGAGTAASGDEAPVGLPAGVVAASSASAGEEAARIETARRLTNGTAEVVGGTGPAVTRIRRRRRSAPAARFWLFRFACCSPDNRVVWQPVIAIRAGTSDSTRDSAMATRLRLDASSAGLERPLSVHIACVTDALRLTLARPASHWMEREQAIAGRLQQRHARLAATLVQPGLFDNRVDRLAGEHDVVLQQAMSRCSTRIAQLSGLADLTADGPSLVFGLLLE